MTNAASSAETTNDGNHQTKVTVSEVFFLRVIIYYINDKDNGFKEAAEFLRERLEGQFPVAENNKIELFPVTVADNFKNVWGQINDLSRDGKHILKRVHFFGHGGEASIYCWRSAVRINEIPNLPELSWDADSIFVLHSCRSGHEFSIRDEQKNENIKVYCIAREFSKKQKTRVLGQMVGANFSLDKGIRRYALFSKRYAYLWAYCSGSKVKKFITEPKSPGNNLLAEYKQLADLSHQIKNNDSEGTTEVEDVYLPSGKLWACQLFFNGENLPRDLNNISDDLYFM